MHAKQRYIVQDALTKEIQPVSTVQIPDRRTILKILCHVFCQVIYLSKSYITKVTFIPINEKKKYMHLKDGNLNQYYHVFSNKDFPRLFKKLNSSIFKLDSI